MLDGNNWWKLVDRDGGAGRGGDEVRKKSKKKKRKGKRSWFFRRLCVPQITKDEVKLPVVRVVWKLATVIDNYCCYSVVIFEQRIVSSNIFHWIIHVVLTSNLQLTMFLSVFLIKI